MSKLDNRYLIGGVAIGAAALTVHGAAHAAELAGVPSPWSYLYPAIGDGLAVVAWRATAARERWRRRFAQVVMVAAATASGLAQGYALASSPDPARPDGLAWGMGIAPALVVLLATILGASREADPAAVRPVEDVDEGEPGAAPPEEPAPVIVLPLAEPPAVEPVPEPVELEPAARSFRLAQAGRGRQCDSDQEHGPHPYTLGAPPELAGDWTCAGYFPPAEVRTNESGFRWEEPTLPVELPPAAPVTSGPAARDAVARVDEVLARMRSDAQPVTPPAVTPSPAEPVTVSPAGDGPAVTPEPVTPPAEDPGGDGDGPTSGARPTPAQQRADLLAGRAWLAQERAAGRRPSGADVARAIGREPRWGQRLVQAVDREVAEAEARQADQPGLRAVR